MGWQRLYFQAAVILTLSWMQWHEAWSADIRPQLAPGVLITVAPDRQPQETFSGPRSVLEILRGIERLDWDPTYSAKTQTLAAVAKAGIFRRRVWCLEFSFKPMGS